ncbi:MAG: 50S ribosomal protein L10 [Candidatus Omnitrophica bacterium]|nr:50S ribosomal protein L10 [Candidatus Omnitrophota bacterium]
MKVGRLYREKMVNTIQKGIESKQVAFVVNYTKLASGDVSALRKTLQQKKAKMYVSRGSLARIALKSSVLSPVTELLEGHTAFVWSDTDAVEIAKLLVKFAEKNDVFVIRGGVMSGKLLKKDDVKRLSDLPAKEVILAQLIGAMKSPMTRVARALNSKQTELILILKQISEKRGGN